MRFEVMSGPKFHVDAAAVKGQPARLFRILALNAGRAVPLEVLIDILSGTARRNTETVAQHVHNYKLDLNRGFPPVNSRIISDRNPPSYTLVLEQADSVDVMEFAALIDDAQKYASTKNLRDAVARVEQALALWESNPAGDLDYTGLTDGNWLRDQAYYELQRRHARRDLAVWSLELGGDRRLEGLIRNLRLWQREDEVFRFEELSWRLLVRAHILTGSREAAEVAVADYEVLIERPSDSLRRLVEHTTSSSQLKPIELSRSKHNAEDLIEVALRATQSDLLSRTMPGSRRIKASHFTTHPDLWVSPSAVSTDTGDLVEDVTAQIFDGLQLASDAAGGSHQLAQRWLVLGSAGVGKSTLGLMLVTNLMERRINAGNGPIPILLDLRHFRQENVGEFCGPDWLNGQILSIFTSAREWSQEVAGKVQQAGYQVIVDSLDEFLVGRTHADVQRLLHAPVLRDANVLMCRSQFHDQYLQGSEIAARRSVLELSPWKPHARDMYIRAYYDVFYPEKGIETGDRLIARLRQSHEMASVCSVPVRLNMALDLLEPSRERLPQRIDLLGLYDTYLGHLLAIEAARAGSVLSASEKFALLEELAWSYYDEGSMGEADPPVFAEAELSEFLIAYFPDRTKEERADTLWDLKYRTILEVNKQRVRLSRDLLHFSHKSYQEYLVATKAYRAFLQNPEATAHVMRNYLSPEVGEFLKEYLVLINREPGLRTRAASNGLRALRTVARDRAVSEHNDPRTRIALEQLYYYLGNLELPEVQDSLEAQMKDETDPWLRRGLAIGLAFSGRSEPIAKYISELRSERDVLGAEGPLNAVNIGSALSYFGDQPFDSARPDIDAKLPGSGRTVSTFLYQLTTETERGCWRIDLYTLVDLWRWRPMARPSIRATVLERVEEIESTLDRLSHDPYSSAWLELDEFRSVVKECLDTPVGKFDG